MGINLKYAEDMSVINILTIRTKKTELTLIKLLLKEQSDQALIYY